MTDKTPKGTFTERLIRSGRSPIHFILCRDKHGHIAHYFLKTTNEKIRLLSSKKGEVEPGDYGTVVASGFGYLPTEVVRLRLLADHGYDFNDICADYIREYGAQL